MDKLIGKQEDTKNNIIKSHNNYKKSPKDRITTQYIDSRLQNLEKVWIQFYTVHERILENTSKAERDELDYFKKDFYNEAEEIYLDYKTNLNLDRGKIAMPLPSVPIMSQSNSTSCEVKLPQIKLPSFSGRYEEWESYYDMFLSLIHNNASLTGVQKLHYLKSSLCGEPANLIKDLATTENNYNEAWSQLIRRYKNMRYNTNEILKKMFGQKTLSSESATAVKSLLDTTNSCLKALNNIGVNTDTWDVMIIYIVNSKLDNESRKEWESEVNATVEDLPTWKQMILFLERRFRTIEMIENIPLTKSAIQPKKPSPIKSKSLHAATITPETNNHKLVICSMCGEQHPLYHCQQFQKLSPQERSHCVQTKGLCFNCLTPTHAVKYCKKAMSCRRCGRRHHSLLHFENRDLAPNEYTSRAKSPEKRESEINVVNERVATHFVSEKQNYQHSLLATAIVNAIARNKVSHKIRALIDQGSEASFITEATVQMLGLKKLSVNGLISGVGEGQMRTKSMVTLTIQSIHNPSFTIQVNAFVLNTLTKFLPSNNIKVTDWPELESIALADSEYGYPRKIDLLLGVEIHSEILLGGVIKHPIHGNPIAQNTQLGWVLSGRITNQQSLPERNMISLHTSYQTEKLLKAFWEIEIEPDCIEKKLSNEERACEDLFQKTTSRDDTGRYIVYLPFKTDKPECVNGRSKEIAKKRFMLLEKKLSQNSSLQQQYKDAIEDYIKQNHARLICSQEEIENPNAVYLPHHAVIREDRETTKLRPVFDASCKGMNSIALNDDLMVGPKIQQDLRHILLRWRKHPICIVADLVQMYRQIRVHDKHVDYQRFFWRSSPLEPMQHYQMMRLTFGTACAPYLACRSLQQLARDEHTHYPVASEITINDFYMDDLLTGCETETEAIEIYEQLNNLMRAGGFQIQKWCSNNEGLLEYIREENKGTNQPMIFKSNDMVKVLGICWNKRTDNFEYTIQISDDEQPVTKRNVLSIIARLYDPMGWIAPIIITAKLYIQKLWKSSVDWDEPLHSDLLKEWITFKEDLKRVKGIEIPRWLNTNKDSIVELHAYADASQTAYGAVVYMKVTSESRVHVSLITAKTKVAPIEKEISIPRLELCGALLAAKLLFEVSQVMSIPKSRLHAWSDSQVVLAWIRGEPHRWVTFVSNRVSAIRTMLDPEQWSYVRTNDNPADCASRGVSCSELKDHPLWWHGPSWLLERNLYIITEEFDTDEEERRIKTFTNQIEIKEDFIWTRFSSLTKMLYTLSYCFKLLELKLPRAQRTKLNKFVTTEERNRVLEHCIRETQGLYFSDEIELLKSEKNIPKKSILHSLNPFLDKNGVLRVGGRIDKAIIQYDKRHPVILPSKSHLSKLIVMDAHIRTLHGGPQLMHNYLRSKYWIIRARVLTKRVFRECTVCKRYSKEKHNPMMGQLPEVRLRPSKAFKSSGVDFTGFINLRFSPGRGSKSYKGYICLFICMVTRAIHLEAVSDLTAHGFIAAFRRFVSRRGACLDLYSDNATNFVGADKELQRMFSKAKSDFQNDVRQLLDCEGTNWHYIPPHAPNFGGLWEAGVRSAKSHLKRVIGESTLTFEELTTVLSQIEACLNSRPLTHLSDNPDDPLPLTPGHFLVGEPLIVIPDEDFSQSSCTGMSRWRMSQKMVNDFWRKWSDEYLTTLQQRFKWTKREQEPDIDDVVIIREDNMPPAKWMLGRVLEKHTGKDGVTRVVTLKTKNGICKRACNRLCFLFKN